MQHAEARVAGFVRYLRKEGYAVGVRETMDALKVLQAGKEPDVPLTRHVLRSLSCHDREQWVRFDRLFDQFWFPEYDQSSASTRSNAGLMRRYGAFAGLAGASEENIYHDESTLLSAGAGRQKTISRADFRFLNDRQAAREIEKLAENLAMRLKKKVRQRRRYSRHGRETDFRRTIRCSLSQGGLPLERIYRIRRQEPPHLVILHDVSHSMAWNNPLLFRFSRGLMRTFPQSDAFAFHTELFCVSTLYRERSLQVMRERLEKRNHLWMGGTCIAESLAAFNRHWSRSTLRRDTIVIIISDGFDTNEPQHLQRELQQLQQRAKKILWLNPMLGREGFEPDEQFLQCTRDHVDRFAPAHSLESLQQAVQYLATA